MTAPRPSPVLYLIACAAPPARALGELVGLLQTQGWAVCVIATPRAASWIDAGALATRTGYPVRHDYKQPDDPDVLPRANALAVVPATFNTVNKWAAGISDTFALGILNEAIGLELPIIAAPYAKASLAAHPAFARNLRALSDWGVTILPNESIRQKSAAGHAFNWRPVVDATRTALST